MGSVKKAFQRMKLLAAFARILRVDDSGDLQVMQIEGFVGEIREGVDRIGEFGFASNPPPDGQAVFLSLVGSRGSLVVIGTEDRRYRPKDTPLGGSGLYTTDAGTRIRVNPDGTVEITGAGNVTVGGVAVVVNASGDAEVNATGEARVTAATVRLGPATEIDGLAFASHFHNDPVTGVTGPAQGVAIP